MTPFNLDMDGDRKDMLKWISERNTHIPVSDLEFLIGIPPLAADDEEWES